MGTLVLNAVFLVVEVGVGLWTGSLALLSDAAHMLSDVAAIVVALGAAQLARRAATAASTFGFKRAETLGAFLNGIALVAAAGWIVWEGIDRLREGPPAVAAMPILVVGFLGLVINLGSAAWLATSDRDNLNVRGVLAHMLADALGSVGAMVAAVFVMMGMPAADVVVSLFIAALVAWGAWSILDSSTRVLLQFAPVGLDVDGVRRGLLEVDGVDEVHDLHVWSLDGQRSVLSAHLVSPTESEARGAAQAVRDMLSDEWGIRHTTLQFEVGEDCHGCPLTEHSHAH